jgi:hypothetical protein
LNQDNEQPGGIIVRSLLMVRKGIIKAGEHMADDDSSEGHEGLDFLRAQPANDETLIKELAERFLWQVHGRDRRGRRSSLAPVRLRLVAGRIPGPLPVDLPVPDSSRIVGSMVLSQSVTVLLDVDLPANKVLQFYIERLTQAGWTQLDPVTPGGGGFAFASESDGRTAQFCRSEQGPTIIVQAIDSTEKPAQVQVTLDVNPEHSPCLPGLRPYMMPIAEVLPRLAPPIGAEVYSGSSGSGSTYVSSEALLISSLDRAGIHNHYIAQLTGLGWVLHDQGLSGPAVWSNWSFETKAGDAWQGQLFVLQRPWSKRKYEVSIQAEITTVDPESEFPSDGGFRGSSFAHYLTSRPRRSDK